MDIDLDPLDDIFADAGVKTARPVGKFQPKAKAKFRPAKKDSAAASVPSSQPPQNTDTTSLAVSSVPVETAKPSENCPGVVFNGKERGCAALEKPVPENVDIFIGLDALDDILQNNTPELVAEGTTMQSEVSNTENDGAHALPGPASIEDATTTCTGDDVPTCPDLSAGLDPLTAGEPIVSSVDGHGQMHDGDLYGEEMDIMDSINMSELTAKSEQRGGKFQPKPKIKTSQKKIYEANDPVSCSLGSQSVHPESNYVEKDSIPTFQQDDMLDLSDLGFSHTLPTEVTPEVPLTEELVNHMETTQMDSGIHLDAVPEIPVKLASHWANTGRSKTQPSPTSSPQQQEASISGEANDMRRSLRPRKSNTNLHELVVEADEVLTGGESEEIPINSAVEDENVLDGEFQPENESKKKKIKQKPKKPDDGGNEKPARKRKKTEEVLNKSADAKPKKFSHSTRRRRVDKALLETPEDEIDYHKVPLRDLILLAEHRERIMKKDEATSGATATQQSNGNSSSHYNEDETFRTRQNGEDNDGQGSPVMEDTTVYFNYQTHMDKTPATRWSKQETELFYEAVQQFGTDLSMIQQLFPDRTRRQVKLKYKKEERQHPLRLREALTNRSKDHSHFQKVIEHLRKIAAVENQNADNDDPIDLSGNEVDEGTSNVDKEETKDEGIEEEEKGDDAAANESDVQSPSNLDDNEDDLFMWSQYKSDT